MSGTLYLVATPIGNLEDMTYRAVRILSEVDLIAAEDTRNSIKLLNHFEIHTPMTSYHEFNKYDKAKQLVDQILAGKNIAVITDAGMPGISDPGEELVRQALAAGITVSAAPGACACVTALVISGLPTRRFAFEAFLPQDKKEKKAVLEELKTETRTIVLYEAPHRLRRTLQELYEALGDRALTIVKELTKKYETIRQTTLVQATCFYETEEPRGEYVLVISGLDAEQEKEKRQQAFLQMTARDHVAMYEAEGMTKKEAIRQAAIDRGVPKREVYNAVMTKQITKEGTGVWLG